MIKEERAEVKKERDERIKEIEARDGMEENRVARKTRLMELELAVVHERAAAEQAARDNPAPAQPPPVHPHVPPHVPAHAPPAAGPAPLQRRYREVQSLHPGVLGIHQSPEELRLFQNSFRNWYQISCLDTLDVPQQIFSLKKCCDLSLQQKTYLGSTQH